MDQHATNPLWQEHIERLHSLYDMTPAPAQSATRRVVVNDIEAEEARRGEWTASQPGRLGRLLLADIALWLEFFAIARAG